MNVARALVAVVLLSAGARAAEPWQWRGVACADGGTLELPSLLSALELELGPAAAEAPAALQLTWPCGGDGAVKLSVERGAARVESLVELAEVPPHLRERMVALVARELLISARTVSQLEPTAPATRAEPTPVEPDRARPAEASRTGLRVAASSRLFVAGPTPLFGGVVEWAWRWVRIGALLEATRNDVPEALLSALLASVVIGAMPFQWQQGSWQTGLGALLEGGFITTWSTAKLEGFRGVTSLVPLGGVLLRSEIGFVPSRSWALTLSLDVGFDLGNRVFVLGRQELSLHGFCGALRLGVSF